MRHSSKAYRKLNLPYFTTRFVADMSPVERELYWAAQKIHNKMWSQRRRDEKVIPLSAVRLELASNPKHYKVAEYAVSKGCRVEVDCLEEEIWTPYNIVLYIKEES